MAAVEWLPTNPSAGPINLGTSIIRDPSRFKTGLLTVGVLAGSAASAFWSGHDRTAFNFGNEEWFGETTYAGGADKASHFVFYNGLSRGLGVAYQDLGYTKNKAITMAFATSVAAGLIVEVGDGLTVFGFAWEDLVMDTLGAGTAALDHALRHGRHDRVSASERSPPNSLRPAAGLPASARTTPRKSTRRT